MVSEGSGGTFATLTHAKLRAAQGDVAGAARILRVILEAQPDHDEARELLRELDPRVAVTYREPTEDAAADVEAATSAGLKERFRRALGGTPRTSPATRLRAWIERIRRNRGVDGVR